MTPRVLVTVRPGPVLHLWQDGREVARVPLDTPAALALIAALAAEVRAVHSPAGRPRDGAGAAPCHPRGKAQGPPRGATGGRCEGAAAGNCDTVTAGGGA
jgi:hypothetical protein